MRSDDLLPADLIVLATGYLGLEHLVRKIKAAEAGLIQPGTADEHREAVAQ